jgi:metallo-beta-lactamase family protein
MVTLRFLGATNTVTGSRFLLSSGSDQILIDCGLFQGPKELRLRNWSPLPQNGRHLQYVVLTHAHLDHTGFFPRLVKEGFHGEVYATPATVDLCGLLWPDSGHLQEEDARFANKQGFSKHAPALPLYTEIEATEALAFLRKVPYNTEHRLSPQMFFSVLPAGHILGSSFVKVTVEENTSSITLLFSGDLGRYDQPITPDPTPVTETDYLLLESTYGDRLHPTTDPRIALTKVINDTVQRRGMVLIPSFAVGRTQEILYILRELEDGGQIPHLPVFVDSPMAVDATKILMKYPEEHDLELTQMLRAGADPLNTHKVNFVRDSERSKALNEQRYPMIVIAASGMATGGRILHHLVHRLPDPRNTILFVGYQAEGTRGRSLLEGAAAIKIHGQMIPVRAQIQLLDHFSAHADWSEILRWLGNFRRPPRTTFLVHGEAEPRQALADRIKQQLGWPVVLPTYVEKFELSD